LLRPRCLSATAAPRSEILFVVVTDTHLGYKDQDKAERVWMQTAAEIDKATGAFVLHLGDVVDGGREAQYPKYLEGRQLIHKPVHEVCFPSGLYNQDRQLEEKGAPGYNPLEFRSGFTRVAIRNGTIAIEFQPLGVPDVLKKELPRRTA